MIKLFAIILKVIFEESIKFFVVLSLGQYIKMYFAKSKNQKKKVWEKLIEILKIAKDLIIITACLCGIAFAGYHVGKINERKRWCDKYTNMPWLMPEICKNTQVLLEKKPH